MESTKGLSLSTTRHSLKVVLSKGFDPETIKRTFNNPREVYPSRNHPGQYRVTGNGLCLVGEPIGTSFRLITVYEDKVLTPPRADQLLTEEGRRYAERYAQGLGRG